MAKKAKSKAKPKGKGKETQLDIPDEWIGKSVEELKTLIAGLESQLNDSRQNRNKAQVEHGSIQSYYDVTREQIRELDMQIERKNLEIENTEEDNSTELRVYEQKANFIKYCHDNKLKNAFDDNDQKVKVSVSDHGRRAMELEEAKMDMRNVLTGTEKQHTNEMSNLQEDSKMDLAQLKEKLDADVDLFEQKCGDQHVQLQQELDSRGTAELKIVESRKESNLEDLLESHKRRCIDMRKYFEVVERQEDIDIEDLDAEIRRLKKAAIQNKSCSKSLKESNERCGEELRTCSEKVVTLESKTKTKDKNTNSLRTTNTRLSAIRNTIGEATVKYMQLQEKFNSVEEERNGYRASIHEATSEACKDDMMKHDFLQENLERVSENNAIIEQHLRHIVSSAGIDRENSETLQSNLHEFIQDNSQELEKLNLSIANATKSYNKAYQSCHSELINHGVSKVEADSIDALLENEDKVAHLSNNA
mmetsp:Transcript_30638/g.55544  ORF Transcript_30638/g.55544 Transcript_30638/m.55544 type:complete len:476 (+) Transcript_30638:20-1447(+)